MPMLRLYSAESPWFSAGADRSSGSALQLSLATGALLLCFASLGLFLTLLPVLESRLRLDPAQAGLAIALPVLLGSLARIPLGALADRCGGRVLFPIVLSCAILALALLAFVQTFWQLLACGVLISLSLAVFPVGVAFVSGWYAPRRQGLALGIYGVGNIGAAIAIFLAPAIPAETSLTWSCRLLAALLLAWMLLFALAGRDAPRQGAALDADEVRPPHRSRACAALSLYYFVTFGAYIAMAAYLPTFITDMFGLRPRDVGARTAGFIILAAALRPLGGLFADSLRAQALLPRVFQATAVMVALMMWPHIVTFTIGALGMAAAVGFGSGVVFKLVATGFPRSIGAAAGLVGAAGGIGGFLPALLLGVLPDLTGSYALGFMLLTITAVACSILAGSSADESGAGAAKEESPAARADAY